MENLLLLLLLLGLHLLLIMPFTKTPLDKIKKPSNRSQWSIRRSLQNKKPATLELSVLKHNSLGKQCEKDQSIPISCPAAFSPKRGLEARVEWNLTHCSFKAACTSKQYAPQFSLKSFDHEHEMDLKVAYSFEMCNSS